MALRIGVPQFPGSCDEVDALLAAGHVGDAELLWHRDRDLKGVDAVVVPGGFSYGDYLRAGAIAGLSPVMDAIADFAREGGPVLGICNGFQVLCAAGLLPGALLQNADRRFVLRQVELSVETTRTAWTAGATQGQLLSIPAKHQSGRWWAPEDLLAEVRDQDQIVFRYAANGNFNGSLDDVAGVCNAAGNVLGLMPHPEHAVDVLTGSVDGLKLIGAPA
jgi:phosphoribosylformylglycinamidine synthase